MTATSAVAKALVNLLKYTNMKEDYLAPSARTFQEDVDDAVSIRRFMDDHNKTAVCACCSRHRENCGMHQFPFAEIPNMELLANDHRRPSPELPRDALTTFKGYCLQVGEMKREKIL